MSGPRRRSEPQPGRVDVGKQDSHMPPETPDWKRRESGLYLPDGVPDGGKKSPVGFARELVDKPSEAASK